VSEARPELHAPTGPPRGYDLRVMVTTLPGPVLDRLLDLALAGKVDQVEKELARRRKGSRAA